MGCDIYLSLEVFNEDAKQWEEIALYVRDENGNFERRDPWEGRNYDLFGALAGVRGSGYEPIDLPRGLPYNISSTVKERAEEADYYFGFSYLDFIELIKYQESHKYFNSFNSFMDSLWYVLDMYWVFSVDCPGKVRIVFWFDA